MGRGLLRGRGVKNQGNVHAEPKNEGIVLSDSAASFPAIAFALRGNAEAQSGADTAQSHSAHAECPGCLLPCPCAPWHIMPQALRRMDHWIFMDHMDHWIFWVQTRAGTE